MMVPSTDVIGVLNHSQTMIWPSLVTFSFVLRSPPERASNSVNAASTTGRVPRE